MKKRPRGYHSLSRRIVLQFCIFTLVLSVAHSFISFVMMYTLEDSFIEKDIKKELAYLQTKYKESGVWPEPRTSNITLHFSVDSFPKDLKQQFVDNPIAREFYGEDERHYHIVEVTEHENLYVVAEVSDLLYVRPIRSGILTFLAFNGVLLSLIACIVAWFIGRRTAKPLRQLAELVDGVAPEQIPDRFAHHYPNDEVGILANTLEQTFQKIASALEREQCFTRDVSHELRTPLAIIKNGAELQLSSNSNTSADIEVTKRILKAAEQMDKTVHTLLMLAREEHSNANKEDVNLMPIIEQSILDHRTLLEGKEIDIHLDDNCNSKVLAQPGMLKVLLDNVISNAFQHTQSGTVSVSFSAGKLSVKDTGKGIEEAISERITEVAVKGSQSTGFGFGLSIVKRLCEHQNWQLEVTSNNGTTVSVLLY